ncbi:hypothetical protein AADZ90_021265 [Aestuariibius sp. 2305UL40-4]|uniref:hypothetical protein n=1 Tax=Aestuariibius violaceus TaxID=3234132 RepID=UPI00345E399E
MNACVSFGDFADGFYQFDVFGWLSWNGFGWAAVGDNDRSIRAQPTRLSAAVHDAIAECCRQDWVEKYHHLLAVTIDDEHLQSVRRRSDVNGDQINALDHIAGVSRRWSLKQHVSFPALDIGAGECGFGFSHLIHGLFLSLGVECLSEGQLI